MFASDEFDLALPAWLNFDPASRSFNGDAPLDSKGAVDVNLRVMEH